MNNKMGEIVKAPQPGDNWYTRLLQPRLPFYRRPMRPADLSSSLVKMMLSRRHAMEDANYTKVVPNRFIIEVNDQVYQQYYKAIQGQVVRQWADMLTARLNTTNSRHGRLEFRLGGPIKIEVRPVGDLQSFQARILARIEAQPVGGLTAPMMLDGCLETIPGGRRWSLQAGMTRLGRDENNDIPLLEPNVQAKRLVSGHHAYIRAVEAYFRLFDGSPGGRPSVNGTYVNNKRVPPEGHVLQNGDLIILAAIDPSDPRPDTPGVAAFRFHLPCP